LFLVDTDVISETAPTKVAARERVTAWLARQGDRLFLSTVTVAELQRGVSFLVGMGDKRKGTVLASWADGLLERFSDRILPVDSAVARRAGELFGGAEARGHLPSLADACIAATADLNGFVVVTFNASHFRMLRVAHRLPSEPEDGDR
jgi:predicted nucleic acid-binding protein